MKFSQLVGQKITILTHRIGNSLHTVELAGVEDQGIWIENDSFTDELYVSTGRNAAPPSIKNAKFFVPFSEIVVVMSCDDE